MIKKVNQYFAIMLCLMVVMFGSGVSCKIDNSEDQKMNEDTPEYRLDKYMTPVWSGQVVYNESVLLLLNEHGDFEPISLLYDATEIISVRSGRLDKLYSAKDYSLIDGKLQLNKDAGFNKLANMEYYINFEQAGGTTIRCVNGGYLYYMEGTFWHDRQLAVTYRHTSQYPKEQIPQSKGNKLPKTHKILSEKQPLNIAIYGASNSTGCNSSSFLKVAPFAPTYPKMLEQQLQKNYNNSQITIDTSLCVGGMATNYGVEKIDKLIELAPDLVIIEFGINDAYFNSVETYRNNMEIIIDNINTRLPNTEIILFHGPMTNPECDYSPNRQLNDSLNLFGAELYRFEKEGIVVNDMVKVESYLLTRKRFGDMTGNNINHNNDFKARIVAQSLVKTIQIGE